MFLLRNAEIFHWLVLDDKSRLHQIQEDESSAEHECLYRVY